MKKFATFFKGDRTLLWVTIVSAIFGILCLIFQLISDFSWLGVLKAIGLGISMFAFSFFAISSCFMEKEEDKEIKEKEDSLKT